MKQPAENQLFTQSMSGWPGPGTRGNNCFNMGNQLPQVYSGMGAGVSAFDVGEALARGLHQSEVPQGRSQTRGRPPEGSGFLGDLHWEIKGSLALGCWRTKGPGC